MDKKNIPIILAFIVIIIVVFTPRFSNDIDIVINNFDRCVEAGNPVMESYPRKCESGGVTFTEDVSVKCTKEQREADVCTQEYQPVCGTVNVQCVTEPCDSVKQTFSNSCFACGNSLVESFTPGECIGVGINSI